jgi:hypothetical protein
MATILIRSIKSKMYNYQYMLLAGLTCLLFSKETRFAALVFLCGWAVYFVTTISASTSLYYIASATIEAAIAYTLNARYRAAAYLGYSLILVNIFGLFLYWMKMPALSYDIIYAIISVTQFSLLLARANLDGLSRLHNKHFVVRAVNFDSRGAYDRMYKNSTAQGKNL